MKLYKKNVYYYILDLLMAEIGNSIATTSDELVFDHTSSSLPNVKIEEKKIVITNYKQFETIVDNRIEQIINYTLELSTANGSEAELESEYEKIKNLKDGYNLMKEYYIDINQIYNQLSNDPSEQLLLIEAMVVNEQDEYQSELIAKAVQLTKAGEDFELIIDSQPQLISKDPAVASIVREQIKGLNLDDDFYSNLSQALNENDNNLEIDLSAPRIVLRRTVGTEQHPTILDYQQLISQTGDGQLLDPVDVFDQVAIFESELDALNSEQSDFYNVLPMNREQMLISHFIKTEDLAIEGPAGTGKTHSIINVIADQLAADKTILVASEKVQTIEHIYKMLPAVLQDFAILNFHDSNFSFKQLELVLRNLVATVDGINSSQLEASLEQLETRRSQLIIDIQAAQDQWITARSQSLAPIDIDGIKKSYSELSQEINFEHIILDDCLTADISVSKQDIDNVRKLAQVKPLDHEVINFEQLPSVSSLQAFTHIFEAFDNLTFDRLIKLELPPIDSQFITTNCNQLLDYWCKSEAEYNNDCQDIERLSELAIEQVENHGLLTDYKVELPAGSTIRDLEQFFDDYYDQYKLLTYTKLRHHKLLNVTINGQSYRNFDNGIEILDKYLSQQQAKQQADLIAKRFEQYLGTSFTINQLKQICQQFKILNQDEQVTNQLNLFTRCLDNDLNIFETYAQISELITVAKQLANIVELIANTENAIALQNAANQFVSKLNARQDFKPEYKKMTDLLVEQNQIHYANVTLEKLKQALDEASPSLYQKIIDKQCDSSIIDDWRDNYIYSQLAKHNPNLDITLDLDRQLLAVNAELVASKLWLRFSEKISKQQRLGIQVIIALINKIEQGEEDQASELKARLNEQVKQLVDIFPIWLSTREHLPLTLGSNVQTKFDLVVYDESSESSIIGLNVLERGVRKLILGDYRQVSPATIENHHLIDELRTKHSSKLTEIIDYDTSILSYAQANYKTLALTSQYRTNSDVIEFSNKLFYNQNLNVIKPQAVIDGNSIEHYYCSDASCDQQMTNQIEAEQIVDYLQKITSDDKYRNMSIGVISVHGSDQAQLIKSQFYQRVNMMAITNEVKFGAISDFRNSEFDIVVLSLVVCDPLQLANDIIEAQRINLAMTRAKVKQVLFYSLDHKQIGDIDHIYYKLIAYFESKVKTDGKLNLNKSQLYEQFCSLLDATGYHYRVDNQGHDLKAIVKTASGDAIVVVVNAESNDHKFMTDSYQGYKQYLEVGYKLIVLTELDVQTKANEGLQQIINI